MHSPPWSPSAWYLEGPSSATSSPSSAPATRRPTPWRACTPGSVRFCPPWTLPKRPTCRGGRPSRPAETRWTPAARTRRPGGFRKSRALSPSWTAWSLRLAEDLSVSNRFAGWTVDFPKPKHRIYLAYISSAALQRYSHSRPSRVLIY